MLAEPDAKVRGELVDLLRGEGYSVDIANDGDEVLWLADMHPYDLILMEVLLPGKDGMSVVRQLRRKNAGVSAVFLSERRSVEDRVAGLDAGADEYLVKPCAASELSARLRAVLRRERPRRAHVIRVGDLELDLVSRCAMRAGKQIPLTNRESALLEFLMTNSPRPMSKAMIVERVWDQYFDTQTNVVNVYVNYLRKKIDQPGLNPLIHTMRGAGFALRAS
ncbi:MAG TPA: DNA-binding response regulator [Verrucomicrobiales bacterium]|nr:DNA-binding response regulator [Verrucomicrobiales bacterium]